MPKLTTREKYNQVCDELKQIGNPRKLSGTERDHAIKLGKKKSQLLQKLKKETTDIFHHDKPVQIEDKEWWFNGRIIQQQDHPRLPKFVSFSDDDKPGVEKHFTFDDAVTFCLGNPCTSPKRFPIDYIGGVGLKDISKK